MNPKDFKLGNLLHDREGRLCRVEELDKETVTAQAIKGPLTSHPQRPIPLNDEILLDNFGLDYKAKGDEVYWHNYNTDYTVPFNLYEIDGKYYSEDVIENSVEIKYVHELQNLFEAKCQERLIFKT